MPTTTRGYLSTQNDISKATKTMTSWTGRNEQGSVLREMVVVMKEEIKKSQTDRSEALRQQIQIPSRIAGRIASAARKGSHNTQTYRGPSGLHQRPLFLICGNTGHSSSAAIHTGPHGQGIGSRRRIQDSCLLVD